MDRKIADQRLNEIGLLLGFRSKEFIACASDAEIWLYMVDVFYKKISQPFISATDDGTEVGVEWHKGKAKLIVSFYGDGKYSYYYRDGLTEKFCNDHNFKEKSFDTQIQPILESFSDV